MALSIACSTVQDNGTSVCYNLTECDIAVILLHEACMECCTACSWMLSSVSRQPTPGVLAD